MSADDLDILNTPTPRGDHPSAAEKEEEQFGLVLLLQQMSLSELREIARQRGWRVKGASKADYVSALASLLSDPTETARAVTGMPENLREALRAAFVADDGTGITATTMAQAVTALRSASATPIPGRAAVPHVPPTPRGAAPETRDESPGSRSDGTRRPRVRSMGGERPPGPGIKPVEAAALLIDLARWGLVLPWRDSLYDQGRHVLPWHVQRLSPPLSGWCPPTAQPAGMPTPAKNPGWSTDPAKNAGWSTDPAKNAGWSTERARDPRQFVNSLYAVWESIAEAQPALRRAVPLGRDALRPAAAAPDEGVPLPPKASNGVPPERLANRRLHSLAQGWPYVPEELQAWATTRRRAETAAPPLSVPPPPFLTGDAAPLMLAHLAQGDGPSLAAGDGASLAAGDGEELEFLCRLLCELGLVSIEDDRLVAQREQMANFLRRSVADQHKAAAQAYLSVLDWSELDVLLRRDPRLTLWHKPYFALPYDQFRSWLVRLRHLLLRFLASAGEEGWCKLTDIEAALRELWPRFPSALQSERESWLAQAWGLAWIREGPEPGMADPPPQTDAEFDSQSRLADPAHPANPANNAGRSGGPAGAWHHPGERVPADWEASQGALLRVMLEGPLHWLGFAELSYGEGSALPGSSLDPTRPAMPGLRTTGLRQPEPGMGQLAAIRLHGLANWIWDRPTARLELGGMPPGEAVAIDEAAGTISIQPGAVAPHTHTFLGRIARLEEASPERFLYRLHPRAVLATFESGASLSDLLAEWQQVMPRAIPSSFQQTLSQWWTDYGQVRLYDGFGLLELRDEVTLRELEAGTSLSQHIVARLSPRMVLVPEEAVDGLLREFAAKDYTPKEVG